MKVHLLDQAGAVLGEYASDDVAKLAVPQVIDWVEDEAKHAGWVGWLPGTPHYSAPDYRIQSA
jgi:hypothetical protein